MSKLKSEATHQYSDTIQVVRTKFLQLICSYIVRLFQCSHYCDVIMGMAASQITSLTIVYSTVYSEADQRKHQSSASLAFVWGIHRGPVNSPHKWPVTPKMFPFDDVIVKNTPQLHTTDPLCCAKLPVGLRLKWPVIRCAMSLYVISMVWCITIITETSNVVPNIIDH